MIGEILLDAVGGKTDNRLRLRMRKDRQGGNHGVSTDVDQAVLRDL